MHKNHKKRLLSVAAVALAGCLLAGCGALRFVDGYSGATPGENEGGGSVLPWEGAPGSGGESGPALPWATDPEPDTTPETTPANIAYGSAKLLKGTTAIVSVYLDEKDGGNRWSDAEIAQSRAKVAAAATWITGQCRDYGTATTLVLDDGTENSPLFCHTDYEGRFRGGLDSDEGDDFYDDMDELCQKLDSAELRRAYGTDSVAFLLFLPVAGASYTMVHYQDYGMAYYYEYSCLYRDDAYAEPIAPESAMVYAHELLHQFGAPDLYEGSTDPFVTPALTAYVAETCPDEIMYDTENTAGQETNAIPKVIGEITAYRLGLTATCAALDTFPAIADTVPGTFVGAEATPETADPWADTDEYIPAGFAAPAGPGGSTGRTA